MNKYISLTLVALLFMSSCMRRGEGSVDVSTQEDTVPQIGFFPSDFTVDSTKVREGETFTGLTGRLGLGNLASLELVQNCDSIFDAKRMRAGNPVEAY